MSLKVHVLLMTTVISVLGLSSVEANEVIQLEGISILGSTEDSRILTISGWEEVKESELIEFRPIEGAQGALLFKPIHPESFKLDVEYASRLRTNAGKLLKESK